MNEIDTKVDRVAALARERGVAGILVSLQPNFAWLTGGRSNRIDGSVETGAGSLLITRDGARYVVANAIEMPRLRDEALANLQFEPVEYRWSDDHRDPAAPVHAARRVVGGRLGSDAALNGTEMVHDALAGVRVPLTPEEQERYRVLGREVGNAIEQVCRAVQPGLTEAAVAAQVNCAMATLGARATVTLVAADDRISRFRHPVPTPTSWQQRLLIGLCAERDGLVVALSRLVAAEPPSDDMARRTRAAAHVFAELVTATRPGITGADLFARAAGAYAKHGFPGEERLHHQGGAIGYRSRDWIAHAESAHIVQASQAFAWNPSVTGTKIEETALIAERIELITSTTTWPKIVVDAGTFQIEAPDVLVL